MTKPAGTAAGTSSKRVYLFGAGKTDGKADMKNLLGGKGANLAEMASLGLPVPPGFTITTEVCTAYYANGSTLPGRPRAGGGGGARRDRQGRRRALRRRDLTAARLGALRRPRLHARHDGHHPQPRSQRRDREGARRQVRQRALRLRQLSPLHPDVLQRRARRGPWRVRGHPRQPQEPQRLRARHRPRRRRLARGDRRLQGGGGARDRQAVPAGNLRAAVGRDRGRVQLLAQPARQHLSAPARHSRQLGHGRQCAGDGVRQPRRQLGHRRRLHAQSLDGRTRDLRRVPHQRPGRGRRGRHPYAAVADRGSAQGGWRESAVARGGDARHLRRAAAPCSRSSRSATATCRTSSSRSRTASSGCCRPARASAPPGPPSRSPSTWSPKG